MPTKRTFAPPVTGNAYRNYVLAMLTLGYVFNFIDRQVLVILQESIKKELRLSDTQLGILSGFTFAIFYVTLGIPIARLADKTNRRNTVAASIGIWSIMTALSGTARNFIQLLLARIGVGAGEAGGSPSSHAMISDYFPPHKRSTALSIYSAGIYFGVLTGFLTGGYLNQQLGWRVAFFVVGIPGILLSLLFYFTVKEPGRGASDSPGQSFPPNSFRDALKLFYSTKTFVWLAIASALNVFCIYGLLNWAPSFLERIHGMTSTQAGAFLGLIYGIGGAIGSFAGGLVTDHYGKKDKRWYLKVPAFSICLAIPCAAAALFLGNKYLSIAGLGVCGMLQSVYLGPSLAVAHNIFPASLRALTSAVFFLVINLVGLGFGPMVIGIISDALKPTMGVDSLRWALSSVIVISLFSAAFFFKTAKKLVAQ